MKNGSQAQLKENRQPANHELQTTTETEFQTPQATKMASKRRAQTPNDDEEFPPKSKRICKNSRTSPKQDTTSTSTSFPTTNPSHKQIDERFPFHKLIPEIRNKIYGLVLDNYFDQNKAKGHKLGKELPCNAIPYKISEPLDPQKTASTYGFSGQASSKLPSFETFLKRGNQELHQEFASMRIVRSELRLNGVSPRDGVSPSFSLKGRQISALDMQHIDHITYSILKHPYSQNWETTTNVCQARLHALGPALKDLASGTLLPRLSQITIHMQFYSILVLSLEKFVVYRGDSVLDGLRTLLGSGKLQRFKLRMSVPARYTVRTKEIQELISKMVGRTAESKGGRVCGQCVPCKWGMPELHDWDFSFVWEAERAGFLSVRDSEEDVEILETRNCHNCGKDLCAIYEEFEEDEKFV